MRHSSKVVRRPGIHRRPPMNRLKGGGYHQGIPKCNAYARSGRTVHKYSSAGLRRRLVVFLAALVCAVAGIAVPIQKTEAANSSAQQLSGWEIQQQSKDGTFETLLSSAGAVVYQNDPTSGTLEREVIARYSDGALFEANGADDTYSESTVAAEVASKQSERATLSRAQFGGDIDGVTSAESAEPRPIIAIQPGGGVAGADVRVTGSSFDEGGKLGYQASVYWHNADSMQKVCMAKVSVSGQFACSLKVPTGQAAGAVGLHSITARVTNGGPNLAAATTFTLTQVRPSSLVNLHETSIIAGNRASEYEQQGPEGDFREWYATGLPQAGGDIRDELTGLEPSVGNCTGSCAPSIAGRELLRAQVLVGGRWRTILDTSSMSAVKLPAATFGPPPGFIKTKSLSSNVANARPNSLTKPLLEPIVDTNLGLRGVPSTTSGSQTIAPPIPDRQEGLVSQVTPTPSYDVVHRGVTNATLRCCAGGPVMGHPRPWAFFWGNFGTMSSQDADSLSEVYRHLPVNLNEYGVSFADSYLNMNPVTTVGGSIARDIGSGDFAAIYGFQVQESLNSPAPGLWWKWGDNDPVYDIDIPADAVNYGGWDGYHFATPMPQSYALPFPLNFAVHDAIPYTLALVGDDATGQCCDTIGGREHGSHELIEAATDPYPFTGWADFGKSPVSTDGEASDICEFSPESVAYVSVSTFWSNANQKCMPDPAAVLTVDSPTTGEDLDQSPTMVFSGSALDPTEIPQNQDISGDIEWSLDGTTFLGTGASVDVAHLGAGAHTIEADVDNFNGLETSAKIPFTVTAHAPDVQIAEPTGGSQFQLNQPFHMAGTAASNDGEGELSGSALRWIVDGRIVGSGNDFLYPGLTTTGSHTIELQATNGIGQVASQQVSITAVPPSGNPVVTITTAQNDPSGYFCDCNPSGPVTLSVSVTDPIDGMLSGDSIVWQDSIDGFIGYGNTITHTYDGDCDTVTHVVTITATDSLGRQGKATANVLIGQIC